MDRRKPPFATGPISKRPYRSWLITCVLLIGIVLVGAYFRTVNLSDWDGKTGHHPDERFIHHTVAGLRVPQDWRTYFVSNCPSPMPAPRNPSSPPQDWEPSGQSGCSTLNPRNFGWSRGFVYGTLPTTIARIVAEATGRTDVDGVLLVGRSLSAAADVVTLVTLFFLGVLVFGRRIALIAAALYAGAVMPLQQSHFFTVDNFAVCFGTLTLLFATRLGLRGRVHDALLAGLFLGAAVASKVNMAALAAIIGLAAAQAVWRAISSRVEQPSRRWSVRSGAGPLLWGLLLLVLAGGTSLVAFRIFQPDAFTGPNIWNIGLEPRFVERLQDARLTSNGTVDMPPSLQWTRRTPYLFPLQNMIIWGMGIPLGVAAWAGFAFTGWLFLQQRKHTGTIGRYLIPWLWIALYFGWQGQGFNPSMRYFLPIYPPLILFAAWALVKGVEARGWGLTEGLGARSRGPGAAEEPKQRSGLRLGTSALLALGVLAATWIWAWGYTRIYTRPYTRVAATEWLDRQAPNALTTWELWDDPLPRAGNRQLTTFPYAEEELTKYTGIPLATPGDEAGVGLLQQLARTDYVVLTSPRVYASVSRVPQRFPATLRYYQALFDGSLGFELAADISSFPTILGLPINDQSAEEAFFVYDHPRVLIFRRTEAFSIERARQLIIDDIAWDEVYRGLRPAQLKGAPTALQLTVRAWQQLQTIDTAYLFQRPFGPVLSLVAWLVALEALSWAAFGIMWRVKLPLADRGFSVAPMVGLLLLAAPALLGAAVQVPIVRLLLLGWTLLLLLVGGGGLWRERRSWPAFVMAHGGALLISKLVYLLVFVAGFALYTLTSTPAPQTLARWTALIRSPSLPPYDPFFAGGLDPLPYAARVPFALFERLLGLEPVTALALALPTALALAALGVWGAVYNIVPPRDGQGYRRQALLAVAGVFLLLGPGLPLDLGVWRALTTANLDILGLAALVSTTLALGTLFLRSSRWSRWASAVLTALPLVFLRGYGAFFVVSVWLVLAALAWVGERGRRRQWALRCVPTLLIALVIGHPLAWSVALPAPQDPAFNLGTESLLLGLLLPLVAVIAWLVVVSRSLADRVTLQVVATAVLGSTLLGVLLRWPLVLLFVPALMTVTWLMVQAWLPGAANGTPRRYWRTGLIPATTLPVLVTLTMATLAMAGYTRGDVGQLFMVGFVLLACTAGWALSLLLRSQGRMPVMQPAASTLRLAGGFVAILLVGTAIAAILRVAAQEPTHVQQAAPPEVVEAARWLATSSRDGAVVVTAPSATPSPVTTLAALPTLISAVDDQQWLRDAVQPSVNSVIDGRLRAVDAIYGGDAATAEQALRTYQIRYVLLGPAERAAFGESAGAALDVLTQSDDVRLAYDRSGVRVYQATPPEESPQYVAQSVRLTPPRAEPVLGQPVNTLPIVDEYGWNKLAARYPALGIALWLVLLELLGLLAFPLANRIFGRWHDSGWGFSKLIGLLIWGYAVWLPVNLGWWLFSWRSLLFGAVILALPALGFAVTALRTRGSDARSAPPIGPVLKRWVGTEVLFLVAFALWALVRAANPDVWHPYFGGEKPFEFGFLNAILRSPVLPPYDPFFSDGIINYYYYGLYLVALPMKATGIDSAIGFNLAIATLFAFAFSGAYGLGRELTGRRRYGLLAVVLLVGMGTLATAVKVNEAQGLAPVVAALREGFGGFGGRLGAWFWGPSRVIPYTINEFPLFGFLFADLHPHLIALPITLLAMACAIELLQPRRSNSTLALGALVIGTLAAANSWDAPTYALVIGGALVGGAWRTYRGQARVGRTILKLGQATLTAIGLPLAGLVLYAPFFMHYQAMVGGIGIVQRGDTLLQYGLVYGPLLFLVISLVGSITWLVTQRAASHWTVVTRTGAIGLPLLILVLLLTGAALQSEVTIPSPWPLRMVLGFLALLAFGLAVIAQLRDYEWFSLWLVTVGLLVGLGMQVVFVRDHLAGSDWQRMNTVFKFGLQVWALWAIAGAAAVPLIFKQIRRYEVVTGVWLGLLIMLLVPGLLYPLVALPSRLSTRFDTSLPLTLDGLAFMSRAKYTISVDEQRGAAKESVVKEIDLGPDAKAIAWLKQNIAGTPIVATSEAEFYRTYGVRVAANTGLPTILGRLHADEQRSPADVYRREQDVKELFNTPDPATAAELLAKYHVDYVYIGPVERAVYDLAGIAKFEAMRDVLLDVAHENEGVRIYQVRTEALPEVATGQIAPIAMEDAQVALLRAQADANPHDSALAFGLGQRLAALNQPEEAVEVLKRAAAAHPEDVPLHHLLGDILAQVGRDDDAIKAWQHTADIEPTASNINKLGQGLIQLGRWDEAEQALKRALATDPTLPDPYFYLGELYRGRGAAGDEAQARAAYRKYLEIAPSDGAWRSPAETQLQELGD